VKERFVLHRSSETCLVFEEHAEYSNAAQGSRRRSALLAVLSCFYINAIPWLHLELD
jgi:hypothetical protein